MGRHDEESAGILAWRVGGFQFQCYGQAMCDLGPDADVCGRVRSGWCFSYDVTDFIDMTGPVTPCIDDARRLPTWNKAAMKLQYGSASC